MTTKIVFILMLIYGHSVVRSGSYATAALCTTAGTKQSAVGFVQTMPAMTTTAIPIPPGFADSFVCVQGNSP